MRHPHLDPMVVQVFCDASVFAHSQTSAWAGLIIRGLKSEMLSGLTASQVKLTTHVELMALENSLKGGMHRGLILAGDTVIAHIDAQQIPRAIHGSLAFKHDEFAEAFARIQALETGGGFTLVAKHVRAHQADNTGDWRGILNRHIDQQARRVAKREHMRRNNGKLGVRKKRKAKTNGKKA